MQGSNSADLHDTYEGRTAAISRVAHSKYLDLKAILLTGAALAMTLPAIGTADAAPVRKPARTTQVAALDPLEQRAIAGLKQTIDAMTVPYEQFTLANGLRVIVVPDASAATVTVNVWYDVGSKSEPVGRSGFAHLFEHLMFNGSENVPGDYFFPLSSVGAEINGNTSIDRTNYYEIVPPGALDRALYMEADRMGHLLGALDQGVLDEQRGVVQNEKRNGDDGPTSIVDYRVSDVLYGPKHPYGHSVIGSMADLRAANLSDVKTWFRDHYGPNNALIVLSGKVTVAEARSKIERYFGNIPRGPQNVTPAIVPKPMATTVRETLTAPVAEPMIYRYWQVPGVDNDDSRQLDGMMAVLNDDDALKRRLVDDRKLFDNISAMNDSSMQAGQFIIRGRVHAGVDPKVAAAALDAEVAAYLARKPDPSPLARFAAQQVYQTARSLKNASSRGGMIGESVVLQRDPMAFRNNLREYTALTPDSVLATARKWLLQPHYELTVLPGPRVTPKDDIGADGRVVAGSPPAAAPAAPPVPASAVSTGKPAVSANLPAVGVPQDAVFPDVQYATLSNGIKVRYARVSDPLYTSLVLSIDGGVYQLPVAEALVAETMYGQLTEAFGGHSKDWLSRRTDLLGISFSAGLGGLSGSIYVTSPNPNFPEALSMLASALTSPDYPAKDLDRVRRQLAERIPTYRSDANTLVDQVYTELVDAGSPAAERNGIKTPTEIAALTRDKLLAEHRALVRPERASITVTSAKPLAELLPLLEKALGSWKQSGPAEKLLPVTYTPKLSPPQIVIVDMPDAVQATVVGGQWVDMDDRASDEVPYTADQALGGGFTSRINMNLREDKHWTYGASAAFRRNRYGSQYKFESNIQQDEVGAAIGEVRKEVGDIVSGRPISEDEFDRIKMSSIGQASSSYADPGSIIFILEQAKERGRPDDYPKGASQRVRNVKLEDANALLKSNLDVNKWVWVIAGNAELIKPQLTQFGLPIKVVKPTDIIPM